MSAYKKKTFSINDVFSKCDKIRRKLQIWLNLLMISFMEKFIFLQCVKIKWYKRYSLNFIALRIVPYGKQTKKIKNVLCEEKCLIYL